ncbi:MAG: glycosyl transferase group 1 [Candidatus Sulfotelmatobacter sp.]|nr:glycosyl transferase group 1 [Candidatus Sulfotelmatobacter sp.]
MKKIGLFLNARPQEGGMFQYAVAMLAALRVLPADEYSLVIAYADDAWRERVLGCGCSSFPVGFGMFKNWLVKIPAFLPAYFDSWDRATTLFSGWGGSLLRQKCDLWLFPRQEVWSALFPLPVLASVHDLMHRYEPHFPETSSYRRTHYRDAYLRRVCQRARGILVDSEIGKQQVQQSYGTENSRLFVLPYIAGDHLSDGGKGSDFEKKYQLPSKYVFYPAQFWEHKNHVRLVQAIAALREDLPDIRMVLVGSEKNGGSAARKEVEKLGLQRYVRFSGYVPDSDIANFYRRARGLVLPTLFGPTNIPPLEAFALGCPVAVSKVYGMPEQVGDAGLLFDPYSVESIASSIRQLWLDDDLCQTLRRRGKARAAAWGPQQFATSLHGVIQQLTN